MFRSGRMDLVLVKMSAVIIVVLSLQSLTGYIGYLGTSDASWPYATAAFFLNFGIPLLIAGLLWFFPATIIGLKESAELQTEKDLQIGEAYLLIGITLLGLYAFVFGIVDLLYYESLRFAEKRYLDAEIMGIYRASPETDAGRFTNLVQIVLGLLLLVGRRTIAHLLNRARTAGKGAS